MDPLSEKTQKNETVENAQIDTRNPKEKLYDKIPITVKQLDVIIAILVVGMILFILWGAFY